MEVLKFGGTSVKDAGMIRRVGKILQQKWEKDSRGIVVVVSAFGGITDQLLSCADFASKGNEAFLQQLDDIKQRCAETAQELIGEEAGPLLNPLLNELVKMLEGIYLVRDLSTKSKDYIVSFGEVISSIVIAAALKQMGLNAEWLDARKLIRTNSEFAFAIVDQSTTAQNIQKTLSDFEAIAVVPGFIASNEEGETTTLGRGGSDYTAAIFAAALKVPILEIWTDVSGMFTADPRKVEGAFPIGKISFEEAMELSHFGAKVIYPPAIQPVLDEGIPIAIKNTFEPDHVGTIISDHVNGEDMPVTGISSIAPIALLSLSGSGLVGVPGTAMRLFGALYREKINVILITQASSEHSISFAIQPDSIASAQKAIAQEFAHEIAIHAVDPIKIEDEHSIIALVGDKMRAQVGVSGNMFNTLGQNGINIRAIAQGSSERNISAVIQQKDVKKALNVLHDSFFLSQTKKIHLFIVGVGTVGKAFLKQLQTQAKYLKENHRLEIRINGLANSRQMHLDIEGIDLDNWETILAESQSNMALPVFIEEMKTMNLGNSVFIDNTANEELASAYASILSGSISIVTPNKIACASKYENYALLKIIALKQGAKFLFETNVGAGLPVIGTLNDLMKSGDKIHRIQAVLSGTLNFIFNHFQEGTSFHEIVRQAQAAGYTEPDPRLDLNGVDVQRKILILARESGTKMELEEVVIEAFVPDACFETEDVEAFYTSLEKHNSHFEEIRKKAAADGKKLKFVATYENGKAKVGLQSFSPDHLFYNLEGKDNIVLFTTERYFEQPLVVRGAGAGAEVTASGVFADIIRIANP